MNSVDRAPLRIGLFFGSFNPIHNGHLGIARYLLNANYCDRLWFVVSPCNPFKINQTLLPEQDRFEMVSKAIAGDERMKACDVEFSMPKPSYTADTLGWLSVHYPDVQFELIIGEDNLRDFHLWKDYQWIKEHYPLIVYPRSGVDMSTGEFSDLIFVNAPLFPYSSTEIRNKISAGENIEGLIPPSVLPLVIEKYGYKKNK